MREKLIELMKNLDEEFDETCPFYENSYYNCCYDCKYGDGIDVCDYAQRKADYLLRNRVVVLPCKVGSKVYEIIEDTIPEHHYYIEEYEVQDVSTKAVMYADDWTELGYPNLYFTKEDAEKALAERSR